MLDPFRPAGPLTALPQLAGQVASGKCQVQGTKEPKNKGGQTADNNW